MRKNIIIAACIFITAIIAGSFLLSDKNNKPAPDSSRSVGESCAKSFECVLPMDYAARSNCPFQGQCSYRTREDEINRVPQCKENSDCDCGSFYMAEDLIKCSCVNGLCSAIVAE